MKTFKMFHGEMDYRDKWIAVETEKPITEFIRLLVEEEYWVWDSDSCGEDAYQFVIDENGILSFYEVEHNWWWSSEPPCDEDGNGYRLMNQFFVSEIDREKINFKFSTVERDYLILKKE